MVLSARSSFVVPSLPHSALGLTLSLTAIPTPVMGTGVVTPALICLCCALGRWSTLSPVWWCYTGRRGAQGVLEVAARDITGATRTAFAGEGPGAWEWAALGVGMVGLAGTGSGRVRRSRKEELPCRSASMEKVSWGVLRDRPRSLERLLPHLA